jgi:hypothetical protein
LLLLGAPAALTAPSPVQVKGSVAAIAPDGSGGYYLGGSFTAVGGVPINNAAHILANGTVDKSWNPDPSGCGYDEVRALDVSGSNVYLVGLFCSITAPTGTGAVTRDGVAAVNATTGRDTGWNPAPLGVVYALAVSGSTVYLGGQFSRINDPANDTVGGVARINAAAVNATTGVDMGWNPSPDGYVGALAVSGSTVYIGGRFNSVTGPTGTTVVTRYHTAAVNAITGDATSWDPNPYVGSSNPNAGAVNALAASGSTVYIGGQFTTMAGAGTARIARDNAAAVNATTGRATGWDPNPNTPVDAIAVSGSTVYLGGYFASISGPAGTTETIDNGVSAVNTTTGFGAGWSDPLGGGDVGALAAAGSAVYLGSSPSVAVSNAPSAAAITKIKTSRRGAIKLDLEIPRPGKLSIVATPSGGHGTFAHARVSVRRRGTLAVTLTPTAAGKQMLRKHHKLKLVLSISFAANGGKPRKLTYTGLVDR